MDDIKNVIKESGYVESTEAVKVLIEDLKSSIDEAANFVYGVYQMDDVVEYTNKECFDCINAVVKALPEDVMIAVGENPMTCAIPFRSFTGELDVLNVFPETCTYSIGYNLKLKPNSEFSNEKE